MDEKTKKRMEMLKARAYEKSQENAWKKNGLFMDFLKNVSEAKILPHSQSALLLEKLNAKCKISKYGCTNSDSISGATITYEQLKDYFDTSDYYYVIWDNAELPIVKCRLQSIIDNVDDAEAVAINYMIVSEDCSILIKAKKWGEVTVQT